MIFSHRLKEGLLTPRSMKYFFIFYFILCTCISLLAQLNTVEGKQQIIPASGNQTSTTEQFSYPTATMVRINPKKISEGLKMTLGNAGYIGWEKGILYLDKKTNEYALLFPASSSEEAKDKRE